MLGNSHSGDPDEQVEISTEQTENDRPSALAFAIKLQEFWPSDPQLWFVQAEALLKSHSITTEKTKFWSRGPRLASTIRFRGLEYNFGPTREALQRDKKQLYDREFALHNANNSNSYCIWNVWAMENPPNCSGRC